MFKIWLLIMHIFYNDSFFLFYTKSASLDNFLF